MIGNDIVDLALAQKESNWNRKGFLDKIFTKNEKLQIFNAEDSEVMVWNLWSRKEAVYKIYNRQTQIRGYFPLQLECFDLEIIDGIIYGKVAIKETVYYTKTEVKPQFINTIAVENIEDFDTIKTLENRNNIQKINKIPSYFENETLGYKPVSISHHGRFEQIISI
ncbi:MAG: 4-phosphopantetheinyl transferase family protein [Lentimicrobium sp.]|jgi:phosphopantetheinyl transferase (holo-ACP synthase)|nr:4-phosphopantetheinyl transferase family protein [Lentimicrobium sp.]